MQSEAQLCREARAAFATKSSGRFSQVATGSVMKFLSLARRNVLKTGRSFVASKDRVAGGEGERAE